MINANELRLGNWLKNNNAISEIFNPYHQVIGKDISDLCENPLHEAWQQIEPIPLTPEILEKAGFTKEDDGISVYYRLVINRTECISIEDDWSFGLNAADELSTQGYASNPELLKYVHQLQNLYFALTGTELEINL